MSHTFHVDLIIDGKKRPLSPDEAKILCEIVTCGFDSMCEDFTEEEDQKYRTVVDLFPSA